MFHQPIHDVYKRAHTIRLMHITDIVYQNTQHAVVDFIDHLGVRPTLPSLRKTLTDVTKIDLPRPSLPRPSLSAPW